MTLRSYDPRTREVIGTIEETSGSQLQEVLRAAAAAADAAAAAEPTERRRWLHAVADALEAHQDELVALADHETALGLARLNGELVRTAGQLRFYGDVGAEGSYLRATLDTATPTSPLLARVNQPLGPVAVFGASNFPFAFGVLGNDTGSALAAGCPVVIKAHPAHPLLSARLVALAQQACADAEAPRSIIGSVAGLEAGLDVVRSPVVQAVAFTGSQSGGLALWRAANSRDVVIPVFAEMGTVNPVVVTPAASDRMPEVAQGFVDSFLLGSGQFCTKPGLMLAPTGSRAASAVATAMRSAGPQPVMLTEAIAETVAASVTALVAAGAVVVESLEGPRSGWSAPAVVLEAPMTALVRGSRLLDECFGPVVLVAEYADADELERVVGELQGALAGSVICALESSLTPDPDAQHAIRLLERKVGRVTVNDWPTGVAYSWAQQHGGPWPSTTAPAATSVGAAALDRFVRPVTYQSAPERWLPPALQAGNPWRLPRRVDGVLHQVGE